MPESNREVIGRAASTPFLEGYIGENLVRDGVRESHRNLRIGTVFPGNSTTSRKVDVKADYMTVEGVAISPVDLVCDLTLNGAGGLDVGTVSSNTYYYVWLIASPRVEQYALLASLSSLSPTLPTGYQLKRLIAAVRTSGTGMLYRFYFVQNGWFIWNENLAVHPFMLTISETTTFTPLSLLVPPNVAKVARIGLYATKSPDVAARPRNSNWTYAAGACVIVGVSSSPEIGGLDIPITIGSEIEVRSATSSPTGAIRVITHGFWMEV